jgi:hypothetical protein
MEAGMVGSGGTTTSLFRRDASRARRALALVTVALATAGIGVVADSPEAHAASEDVEAVQRTQDLLGYVPSDHRRYCSRIDPETFADGNFGSPIAIVYCDDPAEGVDSVVYAQYEDPNEARARYDQALPDGLPESDGTSTNQCPSQGEWHFADAEDETAGSDACSISEGPDGDPIATMAWTSDENGILALAVNSDGDGPTLKQWWNDNAGPLAEPEVDDELADLTPARRKAVSTRLANRTPDIVKSCEIEGADVSEYTPGQPEWEWLPWLDAHVICKTTTPKRGRVDLFQLAPDNAGDFANAFRDHLTDDEYGSKHPAVCEEAHPIVRNGEEVGEVGCWYFHQTLWAGWYNHDTGVVGAAAIPGVSPSELLSYLKRNKLT